MNKERLKNGLEKMGIAADETALDRFEAFHAIAHLYIDISIYIFYRMYVFLMLIIIS